MSDNTGNGNFLEFNRKVKDNGDLDDGFENEEAHVDNRLQLDFSSEKPNGRSPHGNFTGLELQRKRIPRQTPRLCTIFAI